MVKISPRAEAFIRAIYNKNNSADIRRGEENGQVMVGGISNGTGDFFYWDQGMLEAIRGCKRLLAPPKWWHDAGPFVPFVPMVDPEFSLEEMALAEELVGRRG